jgi:hypothetical protein
MSAHGMLQPLAQSYTLQGSTIYRLQRKERALGSSTPEQKDDSDWTHVAIFHLTAHHTPRELIDVMFEEFSDELNRDDSRTYPQEKGMTKEDFVGYYFARDVFVGLGMSINEEGTQSLSTLEDARAGRDWKSAVAGFYYVCELPAFLTAFSVVTQRNRIFSDKAKLSWSLESCPHFLGYSSHPIMTLFTAL